MSDNYISKENVEDDGAKLEAIDANRTLIIDQYTSDAGIPEGKDIIEASAIKDVFDAFHPSVSVTFIDENEVPVEEKLCFNEMKDFDVNGGKGKLVTNSAFLSGIKSKADNAAKIRKQLEKNTKLKKILADKEAREELKQLLQQMLDELEQ